MSDQEIIYVVDADGKYVGCFSSDLVPDGMIQVPAPSYASQIWDKKKKKWSDPVVVNSYKKLYKTTIWKRCTEQECAAIKTAISNTSPRIQAIFADANYLDQEDELFGMVMSGAIAAVGEARALELLEPEF